MIKIYGELAYSMHLIRGYTTKYKLETKWPFRSHNTSKIKAAKGIISVI